MIILIAYYFIGFSLSEIILQKKIQVDCPTLFLIRNRIPVKLFYYSIIAY